MTYLPLIIGLTVIAGVIYLIERGIVKRRDTKQQAAFQTWVETKVTEPAVKQWLLEQDSAEATQRLTELRKFCKQENIDVGLVLQGKLDNQAGLQTQIDQMATTFLNAMQKRTLLHDDLEAFAYYSAYAKSPKKRKYQNEFVPNLYLCLIEEGAVTAPTLDESMKLSNRKRRKMAREAILAASEKDPVKFNYALKQTLLQAPNTPMPATEATAIV